MAIRFQCLACTEPIEVDEEWARLPVRCPYCQRTVTAPSESTISDTNRIPTGRPVRRTIDETVGGEPPVGEIAFSAPGVRSVTTSNRAAVAAFILACAMMGLLGLAAFVMSRHALEVQELQQTIQRAQQNGTGMTEAMMKYIEAQGATMPGWLVAVGMINMCVLASCVATIILGVIGMTRPVRRSMAVAALVVSGMVGIIFIFAFA